MEVKPAPDAPGVKLCCKDVANLKRTEDRPPFTVDTCQVCQCRHFRVDALMAGFFKVIGSPLGGQK